MGAFKNVQEAAKYFEDDRFATENGIELVELTEEYAVAKMELTARHRNAMNNVMGGAIFTLAKGFISDKFGRKPVAVVMASLTLIGIVGFFLGITFAWNPVLVGIFTGMYAGGYWCTSDAMGGNMCAEASPTNLRASVLGAQSLCNMVGMGVSYPAMIVVSIIAGNGALGITCLLCVAVPLLAAILLFSAKVAETKGIDLSTVRGDEWD